MAFNAGDHITAHPDLAGVVLSNVHLAMAAQAAALGGGVAVSYTHLDVYKRQGIRLPDGSGDHEVDCKTDQGAFMLKAEFMKKA